ncbi:hypothetical protein BGW39_007072 [Mortierella sp. 14UC]|nr:hypothetical protein BGW39_007072 [Mortierella sp. 14UC]
MEDFRFLKSVIQKSIIYRLDIDACGFSGPTLDIVNRNRQWEPVLQMMGNGKLGIIAVRNMPGFLLRSGKIPSTLQVKVLDMSEQLISTEEYPKLKKLLLASPNLSELSLLVPSICDGFDQVKQLSRGLKQLPSLLLKQEDGSTASVSYRKGSGEVTSIKLSICAYESHGIFQLPMVTILSVFGDATQNMDAMRVALKAYRQLKTLEPICAPQDFLRSSDAFGAFLSTCIQLETLAFIAPSLTYGIELVRGISALTGTLRNLVVRQPNWSKADVSFVPGAGEVESIKLRICDVESPKLLALPGVKKVAIFSRNRSSTTTMDRDFGDLLHSLFASYPDLETVELLDMDSDSKEAAKSFKQVAKDFSVSQESSSPKDLPEAQDAQVRKPSPRPLVDLPEEYSLLGKAFEAVRWITSMPLLISSADVSNTPTNHAVLPSTPTFALKRHDGSLASVRIDLDANPGSPLLLHICDFASDASFAPACATSLTIMLKRDTQLVELLIPAAIKRCHGLVTLAVVFSYQNMTYPSFLKMLGTVHEATLQRPTLRVFKDWGLVGGKRMANFNIPIT